MLTPKHTKVYLSTLGCKQSEKTVSMCEWDMCPSKQWGHSSASLFISLFLPKRNYLFVMMKPLVMEESKKGVEN